MTITVKKSTNNGASTVLSAIANVIAVCLATIFALVVVSTIAAVEWVIICQIINADLSANNALWEILITLVLFILHCGFALYSLIFEGEGSLEFTVKTIQIYLWSYSIIAFLCYVGYIGYQVFK